MTDVARPLDWVVRLSSDLREWAAALGFADVGVSALSLDEDVAHLRRWLADGRHAGMAYMARDPEQRAQPERLRPGTVSVISCRMDYRHDPAPGRPDARRVLADPTRAYIARYALGRDYHRVMRGRLLRLARQIEAAVGAHGYRVLADSAPALEKAMARDAGLGWIGKNTLLMREDAGSYFFLGEIYTDLALPADPRPPVASACGGCQACLRVCPTNAFTGPYQLDAGRCISYLTIEHHGSIPIELRAAIGNRIFGCDDCQIVCPWNRHAQTAVEPDFVPREGLDAPLAVELFGWEEPEWLRRTEGMALRRVGYARWLRNLAVALGNAPSDPGVIDALLARRDHADPVVAEHVAWALEQHGVR